jgi:outer membrane lipoprotein LolB
MGRLSLQVASDPPQSFSADFELRGSAQVGELRLSTLLGQTLATARWTPEAADLHTPQGNQAYPSMDALTQHLIGTALPLTPLFDWLRGTPTPADGWSPDLSRHPEGRLSARRTHPQPAATLRLVLQ